MHLPDALQQMKYADWNYMVKGMMRVWEFACALNVQQKLNVRLQRDETGAFAQTLGRIGNDDTLMAALYDAYLFSGGRFQEIPGIGASLFPLEFAEEDRLKRIVREAFAEAAILPERSPALA